MNTNINDQPQIHNVSGQAQTINKFNLISHYFIPWHHVQSLSQLETWLLRFYSRVERNCCKNGTAAFIISKSYMAPLEVASRPWVPLEVGTHYIFFLFFPFCTRQINEKENCEEAVLQKIKANFHMIFLIFF